jgi:hypothetical protein
MMQLVQRDMNAVSPGVPNDYVRLLKWVYVMYITR